jgi:two-component system, sensor histidine kinase PdtaS
MAKVLQLHENKSRLIVVAEWCMGCDVLGTDAGLVEPGNPPGKALIDGEPSSFQTLPIGRMRECLKFFFVTTW